MSLPGLDRYLLNDWPAVMTRGWINQLRAGRDVPEYGGREWFAADRSLQIASALVAAESYRRHLLFLPQVIEDELAASRALLDDADTRAYAELADRVSHYDRYGVEWWKQQANLPTHADLLERRGS
jgi:hypothetical protein